jgi:hypothetical protein
LAIEEVESENVRSPSKYQKPPIEDWAINCNQARKLDQIMAKGRVMAKVCIKTGEWLINI